MPTNDTSSADAAGVAAADAIIGAYPGGDPVTELARKWETATDLSSGRASLVAQAFAAELRKAMADSSAVPLALYSAALDEVYRLRQALAYEAGCVAVHLDFKSFPKSRRAVAEQQVARMRSAARGEASAAYADRNSTLMRNCLREAGASESLTRWEFEQQACPPRRTAGEGTSRGTS